ncbi:MAG TPA: hypothetical protein ENN13_04680 [Candidatus Altiarchaeales archaeon]|nr:hypothetical protein [Candidatus Altiarchaeales archaeon]
MRLNMIMQVDKKEEGHYKFIKDLNDRLVESLRRHGADKVVDDYLHVEFVTAEDIEKKRGIAVKVNGLYSPATPVWERPKSTN